MDKEYDWITYRLGLSATKPTWKDKISEIPYSIAYYTSYPFIWLICELWHGVRFAWEDVFDEYR